MSVFIIKCQETIEYEVPIEAETEVHAKEVFYANIDSDLDGYISDSDFLITEIKILNTLGILLVVIRQMYIWS